MSENVYDRDSVLIRGKRRLHRTVVRDWVCGNCGSALRTIWSDEAPHWRTVCAQHPEHEPDGFVTKTSWAYRQHKRWKEEAEAADVLKHLPDELQEAILEGGK